MPLPEYKVVIMGGGGVGKSALTVRFIHQIFVSAYDPTIEDSYRRNLNVDGITVALEVLDTAGTEQFMSLSSLYVRSGDGFLLVFSLTSLDSVAELHTIWEQIQRIKETTHGTGAAARGGGAGARAGPMGEKLERPRVPVVLVGNKLDLQHERQVGREVAVNLSRSWGGVPYYETSARKEINVAAIFEDVVRQMIKADAFASSGSNSSSRRSSRTGASGAGGGAGGGAGRKRRCTLL
ncbi:hypothetical protein JCM3775_002229 [Rhodotorula graminis]